MTEALTSPGNSDYQKLLAENQQLRQLLQELVDVTEEKCRTDHHGYCQAHYLDDVNDGGCRVANARAALRS